jgi:hypothetical protein
MKLLELDQLFQAEITGKSQAQTIPVNRINKIEEPLRFEILQLEFVGVIPKEMVPLFGVTV